MASISPILTDHDAGGTVRFERVGTAGRRTALAVLLTGRDQSRDPAVDQFLDFTRTQGVVLDELWAARQQGRVTASALVVPSAGGAAMLFVSPVTSSNADAHSPLIRAACRAQGSTGVTLLQCLLDPGQTREQRSLLGAGFSDLATLVYMHRGADLPHRPLALDDAGLSMISWQDANHQRFADAILASYEGTRDCPGLLGLRPIDDVIAGHRATGVFDPSMWFAFHRGDEPAGVMLLNEVAQRGGFELVYLGLAPPFRRRGLAQRVLRFGLGLVHRRGASGVILAVDQQNSPALRLYRASGFLTTARKIAMIRTFEAE